MLLGVVVVVVAVTARSADAVTWLMPIMVLVTVFLTTFSAPMRVFITAFSAGFRTSSTALLRISSGPVPLEILSSILLLLLLLLVVDDDVFGVIFVGGKDAEVASLPDPRLLLLLLLLLFGLLGSNVDSCMPITMISKDFCDDGGGDEGDCGDGDDDDDDLPF